MPTVYGRTYDCVSLCSLPSSSCCCFCALYGVGMDGWRERRGEVISGLLGGSCPSFSLTVVVVVMY